MSVRSRLEQKERTEEAATKDYVRPAISTTRPQATTSTSVRGRAELAAFIAEPENVVHNPATHGATTGVPIVATSSVRDRMKIAETIKELNKPVPRTEQDALTEFYADYHKAVAERDRREAADKLAAEQRKAQQEAADAEHRRKNLAVTLMYGNLGATPEEITAVEKVVARKYPDGSQRYNADLRWGILSERRAIQESLATPSKPDWAGKL